MHKKANAVVGSGGGGSSSSSVTGAGKRGPQLETSVVVGIFGASLSVYMYIRAIPIGLG